MPLALGAFAPATLAPAWGYAPAPRWGLCPHIPVANCALLLRISPRLMTKFTPMIIRFEQTNRLEYRSFLKWAHHCWPVVIRGRAVHRCIH